MMRLCKRTAVFAAVVSFLLPFGAGGCATPDASGPPPTVDSYVWKRPAARRPESPPQTRRPSQTRAISPRRAPSYNAAWLPRGRRVSRRWKVIVVHHSATPKGGAKVFDRFHRRKGWDELGYHFVIGNGTDTPDGYVEVGSRWQKQKHGAHCKTPDNYYNEHGIGICLVGDFTRGSPSPRQLASLDRLTRFLTRQCGIDPSRVTTHRNITHKTACPGQHFSLGRLRSSLARPAAATSLP